MSDSPLEAPPDGDKAVYLKAQKQRNLVIGLALTLFVALVFAISMIRMSQGLHNDHVNNQKLMHAGSLQQNSGS